METELWLPPYQIHLGSFTASELSAAANLVQLSESGSGNSTGEFERGASSPRSVNTRCSPPPPRRFDLEKEEEEDDEMGSTSRTRRKRYRLIADLYAATALIGEGGDAKRREKRKRGEEEEEEGGEIERRWFGL